ncbi:MAG: hypothetical protein PHX68_03490 [Alphaproteobacteria bacterium]|nr:hypothetical protein [Alphaproteobacteria bacterium]
MSYKEIPLGSGFIASEMPYLHARAELNPAAYPMAMLNVWDKVFKISNPSIPLGTDLFIVERADSFSAVQSNGWTYTQPRLPGCERVCYMATIVNRVGAAAPMLYWGFGCRASACDERRAPKIMLAHFQGRWQDTDASFENIKHFRLENSAASWLNPLETYVAREHVHLSGNPYLENMPYGLSCFDALCIEHCPSLRRFPNHGLAGNGICIIGTGLDALPDPTTAHDLISIGTPHREEVVRPFVRTPYLHIHNTGWMESAHDMQVRFEGMPSVMQVKLGTGVEMKEGSHPMVRASREEKIYRHPDLCTTWRSFGRIAPAERLVAKARRKFNIPKVELQRN